MQFFKHDRAVRESGHDTTHRFDDRTADFVSVDLNSLLYKYETDFAGLLENGIWRQAARPRRGISAMPNTGGSAPPPANRRCWP